MKAEEIASDQLVGRRRGGEEDEDEDGLYWEKWPKPGRFVNSLNDKFVGGRLTELWGEYNASLDLMSDKHNTKFKPYLQ